MKKNLSFLVLVLSISASGQNLLSQLPNQLSADSPFKALKKFYLNSTSPARLADFDDYGAPSNMDCAGAIEISEKAYEFDIMKRYTLIMKGEPSHGPLFLGTPDIKTIVLVSNGYYDKKLLAEPVAKYSQMEKTTSDLILRVTQAPPNFPEEGYPYDMYFRKNGNLIALKYVRRNGQPDAIEAYGYCWRK